MPRKKTNALPPQFTRARQRLHEASSEQKEKTSPTIKQPAKKRPFFATAIQVLNQPITLPKFSYKKTREKTQKHPPQKQVKQAQAVAEETQEDGGFIAAIAEQGAPATLAVQAPVATKPIKQRGSTPVQQALVEEEAVQNPRKHWWSRGKRNGQGAIEKLSDQFSEEDVSAIHAFLQKIRLGGDTAQDTASSGVSAAELRELRKLKKEQEKALAESTDEHADKERERELEERIAFKEERERKRRAEQEKKEQQRAQANRDLDATAKRLATKKKKNGQGGISGVLKSINNLGMGKYRAEFIENLAMMLNAGLPLIDAIKTLQLEMKSKPMRKAVRRIQELVESGQPLWRSMEEQYMFSPYEIALVRVGEEAGNLARNMVYLAEQQEKDRSLRAKVKMAMIYPSIVMVLMFVVVMGLGFFVLPNLVQVLYALNAELPITTKGIILFTELFTEYGKQAVPAMIGGMILFFLLAKYTAFRVVSQWLVFKIPGIGTLAKNATIARFGVILGGLLEAGVPLVESLHSLEDVTNVVAYKKMYSKMTERVALGDSFAICFKEIHGSKKLIPSSMQQLIITGERSGTLSETFQKVASIYEKKAEETAEKLPTILEPMLLLLIGGMVGTIAFSIILPIYSVIGNVGS